MKESKHHHHHHQVEHHVEHVEEGEGNWLVSYADMMTLLVGFFVILMSFSSVDQEEFEILKQSVSKEFGGQYERPYGDVADRIKEQLKKAGLEKQVSIKTNESGVDISFMGTALFDMGSAEIKSGVKALLEALVPEFKKEAAEMDIVIEGHTDDIPIVGAGFLKNNFELSSIRACRVLDFFAENGFVKSKMTAIGYGETRPLVPNRDEQGNAIPENQSQNRRVVIKLTKAKKSAL